MSDDLVKRLRDGDHFERVMSAEQAADRIEELEAKLNTSEEIGKAFEEDAGQLRIKLAKVVAIAEDAIETMESGPFYPEEEARRFRTTLAEIEGETK